MARILTCVTCPPNLIHCASLFPSQVEIRRSAEYSRRQRCDELIPRISTPTVIPESRIERTAPIIISGLLTTVLGLVGGLLAGLGGTVAILGSIL